jgi:phage terminase large subunit-like protein
MAWDLSCRDWEARIREGRSLVPDLPLDRERADLAVAFFDELRLPDVPGTPPLSSAAGEWARDIVRALFGSYDPRTQQRSLEEIFALIAKKNSKTTYLGAGLMLTALWINERPHAEFLFAGPTQAIADLAYSQADGMIALSPELRRWFKRRDHKKEIEDIRPEGGGFRSKLKIRTFDLNILTGPRPAGAFVDELHLLGKKPETPKILRQLRGGRQAYPEAFLVIATTQSDEPPIGAFRDELMTARAIRDGKRSGTMLPILYEFPDEIARDREQWTNPANWPMVMPNLGRSLRLDSLVQDYQTEIEKGDAAVQLWASQHLNIEIGVGLRSDRWPGADHWPMAAVEDGLSLAALLQRCEVAVVGIDGGGLDDLCGIAVIGREKQTGRWLLWTHAIVHPNVLESRKSIAANLLDFERDGDLEFVGAEREDAQEIASRAADIVDQVKAAGLLPDKTAVGLDKIGIDTITDELLSRGYSDDQLAGIAQGYALSGKIATTSFKLFDGSLVHGGQRLMNWCVGNCKIEQKGNALLVTKAASGVAKIDPVMAVFDAVALMSMNPTANTGVYRGIYSDPAVLAAFAA